MTRKLGKAGILALITVLACSYVLAEKCHDKKASFPAQAEKLLMERYPGATIDEIDKEEKEYKLFKAELVLTNGKKIEAVLTSDGTIMEIENEMEAADLPFDVSTIIKPDATIKEVGSKVTHAVMGPVALVEPETTYELEALIDGQLVELKIAPDGTVISRDDKDKDEDKDKDKDHGDDEDNDGEEDDD